LISSLELGIYQGTLFPVSQAMYIIYINPSVIIPKQSRKE